MHSTHFNYILVARLMCLFVLGNGVLNMEEMKIVLQSCTEESHMKIDEEQINELVDVFFEEADEDKDGFISFEELELFLTKHPGVAENLTIT